MKKILFLIHDLGQGGAEKVLVNLVNNMDRNKFDISVTVLFGGGVNEQFLKEDIHYRYVFPKAIPGNSHLMKLLTPKQLHRLCVKEHYDIEVAYLEGPSARVISGCEDQDTKLITWIHSTMQLEKDVYESFRSMKEAESCYNYMDKIVFVSEGVRDAFMNNCDYKGKIEVLYNTMESQKIVCLSKEDIEEHVEDKIKLIAIGTLKEVKGFDRLLRVIKKLTENNYPVHLYLLGIGPMQRLLEQFIEENGLQKDVSMLGYQTNPYKYIAKSDLFVCSSHSEGFSTAVTESLIVGTPVCTVDVSGMREILGESEYGMIVENNESALFKGIEKMIVQPEELEHYREKAIQRGRDFSTEKTVQAVEEIFLK